MLNVVLMLLCLIIVRCASDPILDSENSECPFHGLSRLSNAAVKVEDNKKETIPQPLFNCAATEMTFSQYSSTNDAEQNVHC